MNKSLLLNVGLFLIGGATGSLITYKFCKEKFAQDAENEIKEMKEYYQQKYSDKTKKEVEPDLATNVDINKEEREESDGIYIPEIIPECDSWERDYPTLTLTYYEGDDVLSDSSNKIIENVKELVGTEFKTYFKTHPDIESVFIKNDELKVYYDIVRDEDSYSDYTREYY